MKKVMVLLAVCVMAATLCVGSAEAATWQNATISQAGSSVFGVNFVTLTGTGFTDVQFYIYDSFPDAKNMLAAGLTALATSRNVSVCLDTLTTGSPCYGLIALP